MSSNFPTSFSCKIIEAEPQDVSQAFADLKRDMNPKFVHVFLDKMQRYSVKPDRALFLAIHQNHYIAFATIINRSPVPAELGESKVFLLERYACATGLMVLPEFRNRGVASQFIRQWEGWVLRNELSGIWLVTRQMSDWYRHCFQFSVQGTITRHGVTKTILAKSVR